jgi:citrate lyase beta subunit
VSGFSFRATPKGTVFIEHDGERVKTLRADRARRFLAMAHSTDRVGQQHLIRRTLEEAK